MPQVMLAAGTPRGESGLEKRPSSAASASRARRGRISSPLRRRSPTTGASSLPTASCSRALMRASLSRLQPCTKYIKKQLVAACSSQGCASGSWPAYKLYMARCTRLLPGVRHEAVSAQLQPGISPVKRIVSQPASQAASQAASQSGILPCSNCTRKRSVEVP